MAFDFNLWMSSQTFTSTEEGLLCQNVLSLPSTSTTQEIGNITSTEPEVKLATQDNDDQINDEEDEHQKPKQLKRKKRDRHRKKKKKHKKRHHSKSGFSSSLEEEVENEEPVEEQVVDEVIHKEEGRDSDVDADDEAEYKSRDSDYEDIDADKDVISKNRDSDDEDVDAVEAVIYKSRYLDDEYVDTDEAVAYKSRDSDDEDVDANVAVPYKSRDFDYEYVDTNDVVTYQSRYSDDPDVVVISESRYSSDEDANVEKVVIPKTRISDVDAYKAISSTSSDSNIEAEAAVASDGEYVEMDNKDIVYTPKNVKKQQNHQELHESRSKMTAFLPAQQLWSWSGEGYTRPADKGENSQKLFYKSIKRGKESISVGDSVVFLSTTRADRPYIGRIKEMWETSGAKTVRGMWYYHWDEIPRCKEFAYPGALFESPHMDENDVQTISHKCDILPLQKFKERLDNDQKRFAAVYENHDVYYKAGYYDPYFQIMQLQKGIPFASN